MSTDTYSLRDRILGVYLGSAAGDALGGPVEGWNAGMIKAVYGRVKELLPYTRPMRQYDVQGRAGAITDDTCICDDFARFFLAYPNETDRTPTALIQYLVANAKLELWWQKAAQILRKVEAGELAVEQIKERLIGGGAAWWTPIGIIHAGQPDSAYEETMRLSSVFRQPFEQNLISAIQAAVVASMMPSATVSTITDALLKYSGPLARKLLERAIRIAQKHEGNLDAFVEGIYAEALVTECASEIDGPMPPQATAKDPYRGATVLYAEQIPLAVGAFVFGKGDFVNSMVASVHLGRDTDSICATTGRLAGGLVGLGGIPDKWVQTLQAVNSDKLDILGRANQLADLAGA